VKVREGARACDMRHVVQGHDYTRPKVGAVCMKHTKGGEPPLVLTDVLNEPFQFYWKSAS